MSGLRGYLLRRIVYMIITLWFIISVVFLLFRIVPADPTLAVLDPSLGSSVQSNLRSQFGLDKPLLEQYFIFISQFAQFNLGVSYSSNRPVVDELMIRLTNSLYLMGTAILIAMLIGVFLGMYSAAHKGSAIDTFTVGSGVFVGALPLFWIQLLLLMGLVGVLNWFPSVGTLSSPAPEGFWATLSDRLYHLVLPAGSMALITFGYWALYTRNMLVEALGEDFILTARAKGLPQRKIMVRHALRSVLPPLVTLIFLSIPTLIQSTIVTEIIFSWAGLGNYLFRSVINNDYASAQGTIYIIAIFVVAANFIADIIYGVVDPRIKTGGGSE